MLAIGFAFKVSAVPFHMWTPDVYEGAPRRSPGSCRRRSRPRRSRPSCASSWLRSTAYDTWYPILWWLAALTMVGANLIALVQGNVKRMLAYSSIAHAGYLLVAITAASENGAASAPLLRSSTR
jgi:NADH-quinone oxidoreductase subunit N